MGITTISSRQFNQYASEAKKAAKDGPVFITDRGRPAHVLLSIEEYRKLTGRGKSLLEALAQPGGPEYDFDVEFPRIDFKLKPADFS
ncbi:type II toxin-antitoxin system Phd/YefM family antitoxin [Phyllobacterium endophyticum]|uniref:Antitoxin n=1 Tax=Phyllobacterium endophyticum TaxID=1149773 RepID=A0A2P7B028_9HYPH|nr:type II toxin-antitoxin system Phd/YefM family antitoxin [Phyllobacterium endophyticum]MBB3235536.1 prevent-host-death family protein [Phyllobacterium endophyticum]PSH59826.1 prevent-host-death protein [Phyllobacterium endophyticum]TXR47960.1 type II toxin-antitoxin system Phd/YefM family antitoxin [Phyllobacterium endophyticum]TYR41975.1 type II toxin-antitoxin system Phd/YefM family antitoxin [Phyllobacterium endophyticum]